MLIALSNYIVQPNLVFEEEKKPDKTGVWSSKRRMIISTNYDWNYISSSNIHA